eukprot:GHVL01022526.1.p1 GENE.GHVL01022526.1~~GHVL01022526.1.p1  ORF type:complete len:433 (+),score=61.43 GHVL01022526.1:22-1320(+)
MSDNIIPISELTPYLYHWTVKGRVTSKGPIKTFNGRSGEGKLLAIQILDDKSEVKATFFNAGVEKFGEVLQEGKVYKFSGGTTKVADKRYNNTNHPYEVTFDRHATVVPCDDDPTISTAKFSFTALRDIAEKTPPFSTDVCGVIKEFRPISKTQRKNDGAEVSRRVIVLVDDSGCSMDVTLWADLAEMSDGQFDNNPVICFKGIRVTDYAMGRQASASTGCQIFFESADETAVRVGKWFKEEYSSSSQLKNISQQGGGQGGLATAGRPGQNVKTMSLAEINEDLESVGEQPVYYQFNAMLMSVRGNRVDGQDDGETAAGTAGASKQKGMGTLYYNSCTSCNKKVTQESSGGYYCEKCQSTVEAVPRYMFAIQVGDESSHIWARCFNETGAVVLGGTSAEQFLKQEDGEQSFLQEHLFKVGFYFVDDNDYQAI